MNARITGMLTGITGTEKAAEKELKWDQADSYIFRVDFASPFLMYWDADFM